jgi:hypothetical protein
MAGMKLYFIVGRMHLIEKKKKKNTRKTSYWEAMRKLDRSLDRKERSTRLIEDNQQPGLEHSS